MDMRSSLASGRSNINCGERETQLEIGGGNRGLEVEVENKASDRPSLLSSQKKERKEEFFCSYSLVTIPAPPRDTLSLRLSSSSPRVRECFNTLDRESDREREPRSSLN